MADPSDPPAPGKGAAGRRDFQVVGNVDHAFVTTTFVLADGDVISGLFRREEGETIVYAEPTGKENTISKKQVKERRQSELSLMPEGLADALRPQEFNDLIAFLLSKSGTKK